MLTNDQGADPLHTASETFACYPELRTHFTSHQQAHRMLRTPPHHSTYPYADAYNAREAFISFRKRILDLPDSEIEDIVTTVQNCIKICELPPSASALGLRLLQDICIQSGVLPTTYWIRNVLIESIIAWGGETTSYKGRYDASPVVVRVFHEDSRLQADEQRRRLQLVVREIITHWQLRHPNLVSLVGICRPADHSFRDRGGFNAAEMSPHRLHEMILEYAEHGSALNYLASNDGSQHFLHVVKGVVDGVAYLHSRVPPVIHGDIHYHNILITGSGDALICDFGLSRIRHMIPRTNTQFSEGGHIRFTAPEITSGQIMLCNEASDIYSLAMTIYSLGVGKPPLYHVPGDQRAVRLMEHGERPSYLPGSRMDAFCGPNDAIVPDIWRLLERMWVQEPRDRPGAIDVRDALSIAYGPLFLTHGDPAVPSPLSSPQPPENKQEQVTDSGIGLEPRPADKTSNSLSMSAHLVATRSFISAIVSRYL